MIWRSFRWRVGLLLLGPMVLVLSAVWLAVDVATQANAHQQAESRLEVGARVLRQLLETRGEQLRTSVQVIAADFGFKEAIATRDLETIRSMLLNHGGRVGASRALLLDLEGRILASSDGVEQSVDADALRKLVLQQTRETTVLLGFERLAAQVVLIPVRAPVRIGWVVMSFPLDKALLARLRELTGLDVALLLESSTALPAAQMHEASQLALARIAAELHATQGVVQSRKLAGIDYLVMSMPLAGLDAVLLLPSKEVLEGYAPLRERMVSILVISVLISAIGAAVLARGVTQPVLSLAEVAKRVGLGEYHQQIAELGRRDELGVLAKALGGMQQAIATREAMIAHQAFHDSLTGLPNRAMAQQRLALALARASANEGELVVLILDLDRFKEINDTLGHALGDQVLQQVARRIGSVLRERDLLARLGGDEFLVLVEDADAAAGERLAHRIVESLAVPLELEGMELFLDASVGIAAYPLDHHDADGLLRRADIAMYDAKHSGKACERYRAGRDAGHKERLSLVNELRRAIGRGELCLHFQPKLDLKTQQSRHAEALVRWMHPERGLLGPDQFIGLAENSGRIRELTDWVLREAIGTLASWLGQGLQLGVAVNLSALDLMAADLPDRLADLLNEFSVPPSALLLELTESAVMRDAAYALEVLTRLRALGVGLAIDDFGTGQSSLSRLRRLPITELKIDKSFIFSLARSDSDEVIVRSTIELGHNMGLQVVAEGVEDLRTLNRLRELKCDQVQGYLVARPMPAEAVLEWFRTHAGQEAAA